MEGANIVPVMDMNRNNNYGDCWGGGMWFMWIIVLFALMGGWGGNWNNRGNMGAEIFANGSMTRDQIADQFSMQDIKEGIRGVQNGLCDGFYAQNSTMLNGFNGVQRDIMQTGYQFGSEIAQNRFAAQQCCCEQKQAIASLGYETNRNIDAVRYENARNTCDIVNAVKADILQRVDHTGFSSAGLTGHDKQLHGASLPLFRQRFYNMIIQGTDRTFNTLSGGFCAAVMIIACAMSHTSPNQ